MRVVLLLPSSLVLWILKASSSRFKHAYSQSCRNTSCFRRFTEVAALASPDSAAIGWTPTEIEHLISQAWRPLAVLLDANS